MKINQLSLIEWQLICYLAKYAIKHECERVGSLNTDGKFIAFGVRLDRDFSVKLQKAFTGLAERLILVVDEVNQHGSQYRFNKLFNYKSYESLHKPVWKPPTPKPLTIFEWSILQALHLECWRTPLDVGGRNGSTHSRVLQKLVAHGYAVERNNRQYPKPPSIFKRIKGSNAFKMTKKGFEALVQYKEIRRLNERRTG